MSLIAISGFSRLPNKPMKSTNQVLHRSTMMMNLNQRAGPTVSSVCIRNQMLQLVQACIVAAATAALENDQRPYLLWGAYKAG